MSDQLLTADSVPGTFWGSAPEAYYLGRQSCLYLEKSISREERVTMQAGTKERNCARLGNIQALDTGLATVD